ncbi:uncharacterized protein LOC135154357 [Lytechinus pictus]|uniref:uncharacterized protein LOC135154357 n=1 Tax=Lytechinus pictus TaxID=7653 RepID=UPI0030B9E345
MVQYTYNVPAIFLSIYREIPDTTLLAFARHISADKFFDIGEKLGFAKSELQHIEHRTLYNRKDANIQMLSSWKASQTSVPKAKETLKRVWKSVNQASEENVVKGGKQEDNTEEEQEHDEHHHEEEEMEQDKEIDEEEEDDEGEEEEEEDTDEDEILHKLEVNLIPSPEQRTDGSEYEEPEDLEVIKSSMHDGMEIGDDNDQCGGSPTTGELCSVASPIKSPSLAMELGKALRVDIDDIVRIVALNPAAMKKLAMHLLHRWEKRLGSNEREDRITKILHDYNIQDGSTGLDEITRRISTPQDLIYLSQCTNLKASEIIQVMALSMTFEPNVIRHRAVLRMLQKWVKGGGRRQRLLEIVQAFHFNDAARNVAKGKFGRRVLSSQTSIGFQISQDKITFSTRHLQLFTLSSTYIYGVRFTCEMSLTYSSNKPTLHVIVAHPYNGYLTAVSKRHETVSKLSYQATAVIKFNIESSEDDIKLSFLSDSDNALYIRVPIHCLLGGGCHSSTFDLSPSTANEKKFKARVHIDQGASTLTHHQFTILKEAEPDYAISPTRDRQRFASDYMLEVLSDLVCEIKDARELGYKLGFSYSSVKKYLVRTDSSSRSVSRSALIEMLMDWRRCVRPSEQVEKLKLALDAAGLRHEAEIIFDQKTV